METVFVESRIHSIQRRGVRKNWPDPEKKNTGREVRKTGSGKKKELGW